MGNNSTTRHTTYSRAGQQDRMFIYDGYLVFYNYFPQDGKRHDWMPDVPVFEVPPAGKRICYLFRGDMEEKTNIYTNEPEIYLTPNTSESLYYRLKQDERIIHVHVCDETRTASYITNYCTIMQVTSKQTAVIHAGLDTGVRDKLIKPFCNALSTMLSIDPKIVQALAAMLDSACASRIS